MAANPGLWPKRLPALTDEQKRIREEFMALWHDVLPRYGAVEGFNHAYPLRSRDGSRVRTLEIGAGLGGHLPFEDLATQEYHALELRADMARRITERFPSVTVAVGDCQARIPYDDASFDRVLAIHVLEHLPDLPAALQEVRRVIRPGGTFSVVIPCEGGALYSFCRAISARRLFEKRYNQSYDWFVASEHINVPDEILAELAEDFAVTHSTYFPFRVPVQGMNVCIGLTLKPKV
jgi:SAM-dependent methyltransferase